MPRKFMLTKKKCWTQKRNARTNVFNSSVRLASSQTTPRKQRSLLCMRVSIPRRLTACRPSSTRSRSTSPGLTPSSFVSAPAHPASTPASTPLQPTSTSTSSRPALMPSESCMHVSIPRRLTVCRTPSTHSRSASPPSITSTPAHPPASTPLQPASTSSRPALMPSELCMHVSIPRMLTVCRTSSIHSRSASPALTPSIASTPVHSASTPASTPLQPASTSSRPALMPSEFASQSTSRKLNELHSSLSCNCLPLGWCDRTETDQIRLCKLVSQAVACAQSQPIHISHCIVVEADLSWKVFVNGHCVQRETSTILSVIPDNLDPTTITKLISILESTNICRGYPKREYVDMANTHGGIFRSVDGRVRAKVDSHPVVMNGEFHHVTVRTIECGLISNSPLCNQCKKYGPVLRSIYSQWQGKSRAHELSKFTNNRYLTPSQKDVKLKKLQERVYQERKERMMLEEKIELLTSKSGIEVEPSFHQDLLSIMQDSNSNVEAQFPDGSFRRLFWEQQLQAAKKGPKQMRWHPTLIRWCLNIKMLSSSAYHSLSTSGFVKLPSERTLRDYTHLFQSKTGFQTEVDAMLRKEVGNESWKNYVVLLLDEIKVKESLVYNKYSCEVVGFVELNDINNQISQLENQTANTLPPIATHLLTLMVRGLLTSCKFPYAHFPTESLTGDQIFPIAWEAIERLERIGFRVIAITADGASPNRKFFHMHSAAGNNLCYKSPNPYTSEDRSVYFFSDVPHLMKTTRNCWSHSSKSGTRNLWINGKEILWQQLRCLYDAKTSLSSRSEGLFLLKKLSKEHLDLTSFSRMRVDLAVEVLSDTVAKAFAYYGDSKTVETQRFVEMFDKFFDCLNVRHPTEHIRHRKPFLRPYTSTDDERFTWLEKDFLGYLQEWEDSVESRTDGKDNSTMLLSRETIEGLHITVKSFVELSKYLLGTPELKDKYILSERFSQDPLENYFGQLRSRGGWCQNPTVQACLTSAQTLRIQGSMAMMPVRGNSNRKCRVLKEVNDVIDNTPLPKRKRKKNNVHSSNNTAV